MLTFGSQTQFDRRRLNSFMVAVVAVTVQSWCAFASAAEGDITFSGVPQSVQLNEEFTIDIGFDLGTNELRGYTFTIVIDPQRLIIQELLQSSSNSLFPSPQAGQPLPPTTGVDGNLTIAAFRVSGPIISGQQSLAQVKFRTADNAPGGTASIDIDSIQIAVTPAGGGSSFDLPVNAFEPLSVMVEDSSMEGEGEGAGEG